MRPSLLIVIWEAYYSWEQLHHYSSSFFFSPKLWKQVDAVNKYDPPPEVVAANDHMTQIMYGMLQPQRIFDR